MKVKQIIWRDSRMYLEQCSKDEDFESCIIESVGFVIHEDDKTIVLAGDIIEEDVRRVLVIPKVNIKND